MNDIDSMLVVMQAYKNGAAVQYRLREFKDHGWYEASMPNWNWATAEYRVKPKEGVVYVVLLNGESRARAAQYTNTIVFHGGAHNGPAVFKDREKAEAKAEEMRGRVSDEALKYRVVEVELVE